ncbi:MAG: glycine zipper 2TM domain-containing protein [Candidatus Protistobacter heckmanni]|nr:glycine zipper 2TM domain-containing protein [Candidatus Protistobacter heckmanni]
MGMPQVQPRNNLTLLWIACVAVILFCATGVAAIMGWLPTSKGDVRAETTVAEAAKPADIPALNAPAAPAPAAAPTQQAAAQTAVQTAAPSKPVPVKPVAPSSASKSAPSTYASVSKPVCTFCGVISSIKEEEVKGEASGIGAIGGGAAGAALGRNVGGGNGRILGAVLGGVAGGLVGNETEKRIRSVKRYVVTLRMDDGAVRKLYEKEMPSQQVGERVKIVQGEMQSI